MQFDPEIAKKVGVEEAIMYSNIEFWCSHNKANKKHAYDGYYWTYNSQEAFAEQFPFWSREQIRRILRKLKKNNLIREGNFNKVRWDKTKWYCVTAISNTIGGNQPIEELKATNQLVGSNQPIPDIKHRYINTDIVDTAFASKKKVLVKSRNKGKPYYGELPMWLSEDGFTMKVLSPDGQGWRPFGGTAKDITWK